MRIVALGASNLTRGLPALVSAARARWGADVEIVAALGHGRSYGACSRVLFRGLPGILQCGLWRELDQASPTKTRALVTDVGNDILYGHPVERTLAWVEECVARLQRRSLDVVLTDLPLAGICRLSNAAFLFWRSLFVPGCRLSLGEVRERAERVAAGLEAIAETHATRFVRLRPDWYGLDPIHIRRARRRDAWREILLGDEAGTDPSRGLERRAAFETLRLSLMRAERERLFGFEWRTTQPGRRLPGGASVKLF